MFPLACSAPAGTETHLRWPDPAPRHSLECSGSSSLERSKPWRNSRGSRFSTTPPGWGPDSRYRRGSYREANRPNRSPRDCPDHRSDRCRGRTGSQRRGCSRHRSRLELLATGHEPPDSSLAQTRGCHRYPGGGPNPSVVTSSVRPDSSVGQSAALVKRMSWVRIPLRAQFLEKKAPHQIAHCGLVHYAAL